MGVQLEIGDRHVLMDNGIVKVTLSKPKGIVTGIEYGGIDNLLEIINDEDNRGYWDLYWSEPGGPGIFDVIKGTDFTVIQADENQVELSFTRTWDPSLKGSLVPLNIDKRFVLLRGCSGFYTYAIYERPAGWPDFDLSETRIAFKLRKDRFHYMAISDDRQRIMPMPEDRLPSRSQQLAYPEAVLLTNPVNKDLQGEVDDKYQYSCDNKDNRVHGWVSTNPMVGFWKITPSDEFRNGGPLKQNLTSHVGPTTLAMFHSGHYAGEDLVPKFRDGEPWQKVFGPVFIYVNSIMDGAEAKPSILWEDAKKQMIVEVESWPYNFPVSTNFPKSENRGTVSGVLLIKDNVLEEEEGTPADSAYVGLALPGENGSWQRESKGYQFWTRTDVNGSFTINNIRGGDYNLYAWVPGVIGDYKNQDIITVSAGSTIDLGALTYGAPRDGPTMWEIGVPSRTAAEFYVPDPNPKYINRLYVDHPDKFRQYGLWERYAEIYPNNDLVYTIGVNDYTKDWYFAHVTRRTETGAYQAPTWQVKFKIENVIQGGAYKLRIAIASATLASLQVRFNDPNVVPAHFETPRIGRDNSIARHGIHGLYWLFSVDVSSSWLVQGDNTLFLGQSKYGGVFTGIMYDYIRLEEPQPQD